tara:strand:- start:75 stop:491 length:417 start_codon:yes stop_codon:yes gene_type:complete
LGKRDICRHVIKLYKRRKREKKTREKQIMSETEDKIVVPADKPEISKKVKVDLEVDTSVKDLGPNPYAKIIHMARAVDAWRIFPRLFLTVYIILLYKCVIWYMNLSAPTMEQSGLISIVVGAGAAWFGLYTGSSKKSK